MTPITLAGLGWSEFFTHQVTDLNETLPPVRLTEVQRDLLLGLTGEGAAVTLLPKEKASSYAVGDWVLSDGTFAQHRLDPQTDLGRRASGHTIDRQRIAANLNTIAVVTSCNADFNLARIERYLALILSAGAAPLVLITKADTVDNPQGYVDQAQALSDQATVLALNAKSDATRDRLSSYCIEGQTLALIGSSGVGKTTIRNRLTGESAATQGIREDDARGRHTTTHRSMVQTLAGGWLVDTPGMRELALTDASDGIEALFHDIEALVLQCKFTNCGHDSEPGCAVKAALEAGTLDPKRLDRWEKLRREDAHNSATLSETRSRARAMEKLYRQGKARGRHKRR